VGKKKSEGIGYVIPSTEKQKEMIENTVEVGDNLYLFPSLSDEGVQYLVDMGTGVCQCKTGKNGAPCKHQYILWVNKVSDAINFLPVFSKEQRQMYAEIAIGSALPLHFYEGLHDQVLTLPEPIHAEPSLQSEPARAIAEGLPGNTMCTVCLLVIQCVLFACRMPLKYWVTLPQYGT
jgi:hypothetical protein